MVYYWKCGGRLYLRPADGWEGYGSEVYADMTEWGGGGLGSKRVWVLEIFKWEGSGWYWGVCARGVYRHRERVDVGGDRERTGNEIDAWVT